MAGFSSQYLSASAGSGKTFALSMRFCRLVMAGVPPEEICALTFTRAATREIFAAVVTRLVEGSVPSLPGGLSCDEALARILEALPQLQISTIDAFSSRIARLFAYELGLNPEFSLYEEGAGPEAQEVLRETVRRALRVTSRASADELLRRFDVRYDGSAPSGSLSGRLQAFVRDFGMLAEEHPTGWGNLSALGASLPQICPDRLAAMETLSALPERTVDYDRLTAGIRAHFPKMLEAYHANIDSVRELKARWGGAWKDAAKFRLLGEEGNYRYGSTKTPLSLDAEAQTAARVLWEDLLARDLGQTARHSAALYDALSALNAAAAALSAETGRIGFSELTRTLSRTVGGRLSVRDQGLMYVAYRMDAAVRHLMIDEFQDTSTAQWTVLSNLARELAEEGDGTFFYVGDVKQSIYGWRGGDATLFGDATRVPDIPAGPELLESFRSSPDIIAMVNRAMRFADGEESEYELWQRRPIEDWRAGWHDHRAHRKDAGRAELVALAGTKAQWMETLASFVAQRWKVLSSRQLSMAVLAYQNGLFQGDGDEPGLLNRLRALGVDCAIDGKRRVADAPMGQLVLALLHWMADPRATLWGEVARRLELANANDGETLAVWMKTVAEEGFVAWLGRLFGVGASMHARLTDYDLEILEAVRQGLERLDAKGSCDAAEAMAALRQLQVPCSADANVLSLMTIHHSKGLTFDAVFTVLAGDFINERAVVCETGADWVLEKPLLAETYEAAPALSEARNARREQRFRDDLCCLYVAITRARREQVVLAPIKETGNLVKRAGILFRHLSGETVVPYPKLDGAERMYAAGDPDWWCGEDVALRVCDRPSRQECRPWKRIEGRPQTEVELPSERARTVALSELLAEGADDARNFGVTVHERLAAVAWTAVPPEGMFPEVFRKPAERCELWRERAFSVRVKEGGRVRCFAGQFDRVHLFPETGKAVIYDFKTSRVPAVTQAYARQLRDYRVALSALTSYPREAIRMVLLFTRSGIALEVNAHD